MPLKNKMLYIFDGLVDNICHKVYMFYIYSNESQFAYSKIKQCSNSFLLKSTIDGNLYRFIYKSKNNYKALTINSWFPIKC